MRLIERSNLEPGEPGTRRTVARIAAQIRADRGSPHVRQYAEEVLDVADVEPRDHRGEAEALFEFVRQHLRFTSDPIDVEQLTTAEGLLFDTRYADCDEYVILLGSLLESIGKRVRLKVVRRNRSVPWQHIYLEVLCGGEWVPADATHPHEPMGWETPHGDAFVIYVSAPRDGVGFVQALLPLVGTVVEGLINKDEKDDAEKAAKEAEKREDKRWKRMMKLMQQQQNPALGINPTTGGPLTPAPSLNLPDFKTPNVPAPVVPRPSPVGAATPYGAQLRKLWMPLLAGAGIALLLTRR